MIRNTTFCFHLKIEDYVTPIYSFVILAVFIRNSSHESYSILLNNKTDHKWFKFKNGNNNHFCSIKFNYKKKKKKNSYFDKSCKKNW